MNPETVRDRKTSAQQSSHSPSARIGSAPAVLYGNLAMRPRQCSDPALLCFTVEADRVQRACDLLNVFEQLTDIALQKPPTNLTGSGISSPANQVNSAVPIPTDWTQMVATTFFQGYPQPNPICNGSMQLPQLTTQ